MRPLGIILLAAGLLCLPRLSDAAWRHPHGDSDNSGFADVVTAPAGPGPIQVRIFGTFAPGVGPVIADNGLIYIGSEQGRLFAFRPDGTEAWRRLLLNEQSIKASAVIGADGSVYVVGVDSFHDHSVTPPVVRQRSTLYKFSAGGDLLWHVDFPDFYSAFPATEGRAAIPPRHPISGATAARR
jgi:outer membrane protein assembly factor BamB